MSPLYGLLLAGGESRRMGRDKAAIAYHDRPQLLAAWELLCAQVANAWLSVRDAQDLDPLRASLPTIPDLPGISGPIAGIAAAQAAHPGAAWLVLACDLPLLDPATLAALLRQRDPARLATAYRSSSDGLPEPLCAIYEPHSGVPIQDWIAAGRHCPRKFLLAHDCRLLDLDNPAALDNANTPEERTRLAQAVAERAR